MTVVNISEQQSVLVLQHQWLDFWMRLMVYCGPLPCGCCVCVVQLPASPLLCAGRDRCGPGQHQHWQGDCFLPPIRALGLHPFGAQPNTHTLSLKHTLTLSLSVWSFSSNSRQNTCEIFCFFLLSFFFYELAKDRAWLQGCSLFLRSWRFYCIFSFGVTSAIPKGLTFGY